MTRDLERTPAPLQLVERQLLATEGYLLEVVTSDFPFVSVLAQHLLRAGGKRLRVALTFLCSAFGDRENLETSRRHHRIMLDLLSGTDSWALAQICVDHIQPTKAQYLAMLGDQVGSGFRP